MLRLPGLVAEDGDRSCAGHVVRGHERAAGIGSEAEGGEVVAGNVFANFSLRGRGAHADVHHVVSGLEGGELLELGGVVLEMAVEIVGEEVEIAVVVFVASVDAAVVGVANAVQSRGTGDGQRA